MLPSAQATKKRHKCPQCAQSFTSKVVYDQHLKVHAKEPRHICKECNEEFPDYSRLRYHVNQHKKSLLVCTFCPKVFSASQNLHAHLKLHLKKDPHTCPECGFVSESIVGIEIHRGLTHSAKRSFKCDYCSMELKARAEFAKHLAMHKANTNGFHCASCCENFSSAEDLQAHYVKTPPGRSATDLTHQCTICGVWFATRCHLKHHRESHVHKACEHCGKEIKADLHRHQITCGGRPENTTASENNTSNRKRQISAITDA